MSVAFYSDDSEPIHRKIVTPTVDGPDRSMPVDDIFELDRCIEWIKHNKFTKVALQFPDSLLSDATSIALKVQENTNKEIFILGDTSYGSCCVDEIAADHAAAEAIIHFGHACLSPSQRLPVLYIFGKYFIDVYDATCGFQKIFPDKTSRVIIIYEVMYSHAIRQFAENLKDYENLVVSELEIPCKEYEPCSTENLSDNQLKIIKCRRSFVIPKSQDLNDYCIFYIGSQNQTLTNIMLSFSYCKFYTYNPFKKIADPETLDLNRYLMKRYYYIEKARDAKIIGVLVGTLGVSNYLTAIKYIRELIKGAGKKCYTLVIGKLNIAKLANFAEIEVFVNVSCMESSVINCHDFYQPIITPYELEIALNEAQQWTGDYVIDFSELLPGAAKHIPPTNTPKNYETDISLITGKLRCTSFHIIEEEITESSSAVNRDEMKTSTIHQEAAGEYLNQRSWKGLEQCLGQTPVPDIQQGRKGIACEYEDETSEQNG